MPLRLSTETRDPTHGGVPLLVWIYALVMAFILVHVALWLMLRHTPPSEAFFLYNADRLSVLQQETDSGSPGLVVLGDSRTRYALYDDRQFSDRLTSLYGSRVETVRVTANWAVFEDFEPLIDLIFEARPRLILLQVELLAKERAQPARLLTGRAYLIWRFFGIGPWNPGEQNQHDLQHEMRCEVLADEDVEERRERVFRWVSFDPEGENNRRVKEFAGEARQRGIAVEYFALPITSRGQARLPSFQPDESIPTVVIPEEIPDSSFCDVVHMNPRGRSVYSEWLAGELASRLKGLDN